jgi:hypothetical protein
MLRELGRVRLRQMLVRPRCILGFMYCLLLVQSPRPTR